MRYHVIPSKSKGRTSRERPSQKELWGKITEARSLMKLGRWIPVSVPKLQANFEQLEERFNLDTALPEDQTRILAAALSEITANDYCGTHPPQISYEEEPKVKDQELWAFCWHSRFFGAEMYLKFCFTKGDESSRRLAFASIHESEPK